MSKQSGVEVPEKKRASTNWIAHQKRILSILNCTLINIEDARACAASFQNKADNWNLKDSPFYKKEQWQEFANQSIATANTMESAYLSKRVELLTNITLSDSIEDVLTDREVGEF